MPDKQQIKSKAMKEKVQILIDSCYIIYIM